MSNLGRNDRRIITEQIIHVQTVLTKSVYEQLMKKTNKGTIKGALEVAVDFTIDNYDPEV